MRSAAHASDCTCASCASDLLDPSRRSFARSATAGAAHFQSECRFSQSEISGSSNRQAKIMSPICSGTPASIRASRCLEKVQAAGRACQQPAVLPSQRGWLTSVDSCTIARSIHSSIFMVSMQIHLLLSARLYSHVQTYLRAPHARVSACDRCAARAARFQSCTCVDASHVLLAAAQLPCSHALRQSHGSCKAVQQKPRQIVTKETRKRPWAISFGMRLDRGVPMIPRNTVSQMPAMQHMTIRTHIKHM